MTEAGPVAFLRRLLDTRVNRDGQSAMLEAEAAPSLAQGAELEGPASPFLGPEELLNHSLSQKILDGWLQNRHQVLVPLTFRLDRLDASDIRVLLQFTAAVLATTAMADTPMTAGAERWLRQVGAGEAGLATFREALSDPVPLSHLLQTLQERELQPYAYAAAVSVADTRTAAGRLFANFIAARLMLPADAIRSIDRRYRH